LARRNLRYKPLSDMSRLGRIDYPMTLPPKNVLLS
jgi:hypothetical protein